MARQKQPATATATAGTTFPTAEAVDIGKLVEDLDGMLTPGPIRSHPEGMSAAGSRHPISLSSPLMS
jgi:hypothetical protein